MPYVTDNVRKYIDGGGVPRNPGELNYALTRVALKYLDVSMGKYEDHAAVVAAFECAKLEFYRQMVAPYEDHKRAEHGDVYPTKRVVELGLLSATPDPKVADRNRDHPWDWH